MIIQVLKNRQFPQGVLDLGNLPGSETVLVGMGKGQELWVKGQSTGREPVFGGFNIRPSQGPKGYGLEIVSFVGSPVTKVMAGDMTVETSGPIFLYHMVPLPPGVKEWRPE